MRSSPAQCKVSRVRSLSCFTPQMTNLNAFTRPIRDRRKAICIPECGELEEVTAEDYLLLLVDKFRAHATGFQKGLTLLRGTVRQIKEYEKGDLKCGRHEFWLDRDLIMLDVNITFHISLIAHHFTCTMRIILFSKR